MNWSKWPYGHIFCVKVLFYGFLFLNFGATSYLHAQVSDQDFTEVYKSIISKKSGVLLGTSKDPHYRQDSTLLKETQDLLDFLYDFMDDEHRMNGKGFFDFSGNETNSSSLFRIGAGVDIDQGLYPYELDFSTRVQTLLKDGNFEENVSNIDISFDFHPYQPDPLECKSKYEQEIEKLTKEMQGKPEYVDEYKRLIQKNQLKIESANEVNGLWLENYIIAKRFSDDYLGIDQRYEIGGGFNFSHYSKKLTKKGLSNRAAMLKKPSYEIHGNDLIRCLQSCAPIDNALNLTDHELEVLSKSKSRYLVSNRKQYSKFRLSLLLGFFYELEKVKFSKTLFFNGADTTIKYEFNPTHAWMGEIRPGLVWKPKDKYKLKIHPYIKFPLGKLKNVITDGNLSDERIDYFLDIQTSFQIAIEEHFSISFNYNLIYDNAPRRVFLTQNDGSKVLFFGDQKRSNYGMSLNFDF